MRQRDVVYEKEVILVPRLVSAGATAVDVGANLGVYTVVLSRAVGTEGHVYSFEPGHRAYTQLTRMIRLEGATNVTALNCAVGEDEGSASLVVPEEGPKFAHLSVSPRIGTGTSERVALTTLDAFVRARQLRQLDLLKCDCEGGELSVLRGAEATLACHPVIIAEVAEPHCARFGYAAIQLFEHLRERGFRGFSFEVHRDRLLEVDRPVLDEVGHTWAGLDGHLGNNNYVFIHSRRIDEFAHLIAGARSV